jgi:hypothetical protein
MKNSRLRLIPTLALAVVLMFTICMQVSLAGEPNFGGSGSSGSTSGAGGSK